MTPDISIIICTYNPDLRILERCLNAVASLKIESLKIECFLVDNNSNPPIAEYNVVQSFLKKCPWARLVVETEQGLTFARMRGFKETTAPLVVFFDDDNEPDENYLLGIIDYSKRNPEVGAFGPGVVLVEYTDPVEEWLINYKGHFQEDTVSKEEHSCITAGYQSYYPFGTGLVLKREILIHYQQLLSNKRISSTDRKGNSLNSWGDIQMVWLGLKMGHHAGKTPLLKLNHLINGKKANKGYLKRWAYGCGVGNIPARVEVFPEEKPFYEKQMLSPTKATLLCGLILLKGFYKKDIDLKLAGQIGSIDGYCQVFGKKSPVFTEWLKKWLKLI